MLVELLAGAVFGFLGGLMTAWRIAAKGAVLAWLDDLRDIVKVRKTDRRKKQAVRHTKLDQQLVADALAKEAERKRVRRAHSELKKALPVVNEAVRTYTDSTLVDMKVFISQTFPRETSGAEASAELAKFEHHLVVIEQLRQQVESLSGLGVDLACPVKDWSRADFTHLSVLAGKIDKVTKDYALKL
ncbi:hypothetical protein ACIGJO_04450 [Streptomyces sp. NPDC079020]|uniref:hypothetical protein n=1 Tax=Streptomyces sp. NPDC079020 TaxID=3365722 RepID=UPI0037D2CB5F